ncbi:MAG: GyrI-like domain-containing protein [Treponema sp.]|nr:GyrI-like domain-containing protein [Treponema sp.]
MPYYPVMKYEWKKQEAALYGPKTSPQLLTIPNQQFFMISGRGDPNQEDFADRTGVLYSLAYAVRMMPKSGITPPGYGAYTVYPLEGIWSATDITTVKDKSTYIYTLMIRQPDFVTPEIAEQARAITRKKKPHPLLDAVRFDEIEAGLSVQMLHIGSYDNEPASFAKMHAFMEQARLIRKDEAHHQEIYLSDPRRVEQHKLKTILRYKVKHI